MDIIAIRLINAENLKEQCNSTAGFARKLGKSPTQVRHWFNPNVNKNIGNKIAREIEVAFGKPHGWMDSIHDDGLISTATTQVSYAGKALKKLMDERNYNPNKLAKEMGNKSRQVQAHRLITGVTKEPKDSTLKPFADFFGVSISYFHDEAMPQTSKALEEINQAFMAGKLSESDIELLNAIAKKMSHD